MIRGLWQQQLPALYTFGEANASHARPFVNVASTTRFPVRTFNVTSADLATPPDGPHADSSDRKSAKLHCLPGGNT